MKPIAERRRHRRETYRTHSTVVLDEGLTRLDASMIDRSPGGARIQVATDLGLPPKFYMLFDHKIAPCRLVWRDSLTAGIAYLD